YYLDLTISDENLQNLWTDLNNYIIENEISIGYGGDIGNYLNYGIYNLFKNVVTQENGKLGTFINEPTNTSQSVLATLDGNEKNIYVKVKDGLYKMDSKSLNNGNVSISDNMNISMNNLFLSSPSNYFSWNGNEIISLSPSGVTAINNGNTSIIFPRKASGTIISNAFAGHSIHNAKYYDSNDKIIDIDMSLTSITQLNYYAFIFMDKLKNVILPKTMQYQVFYLNNVLSNVVIPDSVQTIGFGNFYDNKNTFSCNLFVSSSEAKDRIFSLLNVPS
ncbi:MAG: leucine-rich repeat domain-containing protein, partial [Ureaplasma sp.]|nr:leucine-rich repeat domain-containing protein [Ureaplasma sp.]